MALCPFARPQLLPESSTQPRIKPTTIINHSAVSRANSLYGYFSSPGVNLESHFYVAKDGEIIQMIDTGVRADANYKANDFAVSIETWDDGDPDRNPWNAAQFSALVRLHQWLSQTHGIPLRRTTSWDSGGVGGHSDYPGVWTPASGKTCPGLARRPQVNQIIAAAAAQEDDFMALYSDRGELRSDVYNATWVFPQWTVPGTDRTENPGQFVVASRVEAVRAATTAAQALAVAKAAAAGAGLSDAEVARIAEAAAAETTKRLVEGVKVDVALRADS